MKTSRCTAFKNLRSLALAGSGIAALLVTSCNPVATSLAGPDSEEAKPVKTKLHAIPMSEKVNLSDEEWRKILTPEQFRILRQSGTERPFQNEYWNNHERGTFLCSACGNALFDAGTKYDSGTGWPSFYQPLRKDAVEVVGDRSHGMIRDEVRCARCGSHLGHVFDDGPKPTGLRYCMNSAALKLEKEDKKEKAE